MNKRRRYKAKARRRSAPYRRDLFCRFLLHPAWERLLKDSTMDLERFVAKALEPVRELP